MSKKPSKVAIMAVKITIAVERTANGHDPVNGETQVQNITVVVTKGECEFLFLIFD